MVQATVLVVEDDARLRTVVVQLLESEGYQVREANAGPQALAAALADPPALVLTDVWLPGLDGMTLCRRLKADSRTAHVRVVLTSANAFLTEQQGRRAGADAVLPKPFDIRTVLDVVAALLAGAPAGEAGG